MTVVDPCDETHPTLADIARAVNQVHSCLDGHREEQTARWAEQMQVNRDATDKRRQVVQELGAVKADLVGVKADLAGVKDQQTIADGRITKLAKTFGVEAWEPGEKPVRAKTIAGWRGWQVMVAIFGSLSGVVLAYKIVVPLIEPAIHALHHAILAAQ